MSQKQLNFLTPQDKADFNQAEKRILAWMCDGVWRTATEIEAYVGLRSALRRLRALRSHPEVQDVEKKRLSNREFTYRIVMK